MPGKQDRRKRWAVQECNRATCRHQMLVHMHRDAEGRWIDMEDTSCLVCEEDLDDATRCRSFVTAES